MDNRTLTVKGLGIGKPNPVRVMGIINLSPESFYTGSVVTEETDLMNRVREMINQGADILDIGGASTAPKSYYSTEGTSREIELSRVTSSLEIIAENVDIPFSIDTTSSVVAEAALDLGASIVNDVTGLQEDPRMVKLVADRNVPVVIMAHCPEGCKSINDSFDSIKESLKIADTTGVPRENIILDPGIGFGKPAEVDCDILRKLDMFTDFDRPLLVGISRKAFIGTILNEKDPKNRLAGSLAATAIAVGKGADMIRTHDVMETKLTVKMAEAIR
ncbi:MAG: dihydropteroate synthase [Candidatus Thorarchaeota archaeon]|jgi:dihydropteroate synthase